MSQSPQPQSPELGGRIEMQPTTAPPTKRDKRRQQLADRLAEITHNFSQNRDLYCRQELLALQVDMHLITEADPHKGKLLDDQGDQIQKAVEEIASRTMTKSINPPEGAGRIYADFVKEVNDAAEQRDADLELHQRDYEVELAKLHATAAYRERLARNEHTALSTTLRDRLINSLTSKKARLARDKETIEIGESNALLLHPSQYSIMNPDSPSGQQSKRATRHRRDLEGELPSFSEGKRKRKAIESDESPAPPHHEKRARHDGGTSTPLWQSDKPWRNEKNEMENSQIKKGLYSIDKLFTEKELAMTYNAAALASHNYMVKHPPYETETDSPPNGKIELTSDFKALMHNPTDENEDEASARASPVTMERQYSHATRSTRHVPSYQTGIGIDGITDINIPENFQALYRQTPKLPPNLPSVMQKAYVKGDAANQPAGLTPEEAAAELDMIKKCRAYNDDRGYGRNLELEYGGLSMLKNVANPISRSDMKGDHYWVTSNDKGLISELRNELGFDGEPMSKQSSKGGSDMGTPMSRQGTQDGAMTGRGRKGLSRIG